VNAALKAKLLKWLVYAMWALARKFGENLIGAGFGDKTMQVIREVEMSPVQGFERLPQAIAALRQDYYEAPSELAIAFRQTSDWVLGMLIPIAVGVVRVEGNRLMSKALD